MHLKRLATLGLCMALWGCGTSFGIPQPTANEQAVARQIFVEERAKGARAPSSASVAKARVRRVANRVEPVAEDYCRTTAPAGTDCDVQIFVDTDAKQRNAYQFYKDGRPVVLITLPLVQDMQSDDEIAFVIGHEFGHHIAQHIAKQQTAQNVGLILGAAAGAAIANERNGNTASGALVGAAIGSAVGQRAYSQSFELEADTLGTYITRIAGYDPVLGARYFARPERATQANGQLSFWGTHPPDAQRLATVIAAANLFEYYSAQ